MDKNTDELIDIIVEHINLHLKISNFFNSILRIYNSPSILFCDSKEYKRNKHSFSIISYSYYDLLEKDYLKLYNNYLEELEFCNDNSILKQMKLGLYDDYLDTLNELKQIKKTNSVLKKIYSKIEIEGFSDYNEEKIDKFVAENAPYLYHCKEIINYCEKIIDKLSKCYFNLQLEYN
jgi:hypothetical protein